MDNKNKYTKEWQSFKKFIDSCVEENLFSNFTDVNFILKALKSISLKNGFILDACQIKESYYRDGEFYLGLYVCKDNAKAEFKPKLKSVRDTFMKKIGLQKCEYQYQPKFCEDMYISTTIPIEVYKELPSIYQYLEIPFTEQGIWEAFLLNWVNILMPKLGHGNYIYKKLICNEEDLLTINKVDCSPFFNYEIFPSIVINGNEAQLTYCYWSNRKGLVKETKLVSKDGSSMKWDNNVKEHILHLYDTGIRF